MNTISEPRVAVGRWRRKHSDEFKAQVVAACSEPGVSIAAVSMADGVNANLARRWIFDASDGRDRESPAKDRAVAPTAPAKLALPTPFIPVSLPSSPGLLEIRIELRRGAVAINVTWPIGAASECAAWLRELLR